MSFLKYISRTFLQCVTLDSCKTTALIKNTYQIFFVTIIKVISTGDITMPPTSHNCLGLPRTVLSVLNVSSTYVQGLPQSCYMYPTIHTLVHSFPGIRQPVTTSRTQETSTFLWVVTIDVSCLSIT